MRNQATPHSKHANQLSINKTAFRSQSQDLTPDFPLTSYINTHLTDEEILAGDPRLITQERILQVSATHTAEEIASKVNTTRYPDAITPKLVYHRIHTACHSVANKNNTSFEMVKLALNNARIESGVKARINATLGRAGTSEGIEDAATGKKGVPKGSDTSLPLTEIDDEAINYLGSFFSTESTMRAANPLFKRIAKGGSKLPENEDLIRLAARHTVMEMVEMVLDADPLSTITNTKVSARIMDALSMFATARALPRDVVKKEFEGAKQVNGVVARQYEKISSKRKATTKARKEDAKRKTVTFVSPEKYVRGQRDSPEPSVSNDEEEEENEQDLAQLPVQWTAGPRESATPSPDLHDGDDISMTDDSSDATVAWLDSPTYAKYKHATPQSEIYSDEFEMRKEVPKESMTREEAANALLDMRWLSEPDMSVAGAALVLLRIKAEAQDIHMSMPADLND